MSDKYKIIGPVYDLLSTVYSGKQIHRCKTAMHEDIKAGDKVLFAGVGHGRDAVHAAECGAEVTVVDLSATMLKNFEKNLKGRTFKHPIRMVHSDIMKFAEVDTYDYVFANFFLNVFPEGFMVEVMKHLSTLVNKHGALVVGDFHFPTGNWLVRKFQSLYWYVAVLTFTIFAKNAFHEIYNYPKHLESIGFKVEKTKHYNIFALPCYWSLKATRQAD